MKGLPEKATRTMASILIVDDEESVRAMLCATLAKDGHSVTEAGNGCEALTAVRKRAYDVVILDIYMPEKDGLETIGELRQISPAIKIIAVSGGGMHTMLDPLRVASQFGANVTLTKPFDILTLRRAIAELLSSN